MEAEVTVIGGGIAGLSCAWQLSRMGHPVLVLEREAVAGGNVRSIEEAGFRYERGPHTFMGSAVDLFSLADELRLSGEIVSARKSARKRFIARGGAIHPVPTGPWSFITTPLLSAGGKLRLASEPLRTGRGSLSDSAQQFFGRRLGPEAARVLAGAFINGVYAGDPASLSAPAAFPLFWSFEQESGGLIRGAIQHARQGRRAMRERALRGETGPRRKGLFSFRLGLGQLSAALAARLGERVLTGVSVRSLKFREGRFTVLTDGRRFESSLVVVATPPADAGKILAGIDGEASRLVSGIQMAGIAVVHLGYRGRARAVPDGFGFLAPCGEGARSLGVLFPSRLFGGRVPPGGDLLSGFVGGVADAAALALDDESLASIVRLDLARLTGLQSPPDFVRIVRVPQAIPQLTLGHLERMGRLTERLARFPGLALAGNYTRGVGLKDAVASGLEAADQIHAAFCASASMQPAARNHTFTRRAS